MSSSAREAPLQALHWDDSRSQTGFVSSVLLLYRGAAGCPGLPSSWGFACGLRQSGGRESEGPRGRVAKWQSGTGEERERGEGKRDEATEGEARDGEARERESERGEEGQRRSDGATEGGSESSLCGGVATAR